MEYKCPIGDITPTARTKYESSQYLCDNPAVHLFNGTAICTYHARILELRINTYGDIIPTEAKA